MAGRSAIPMCPDRHTLDYPWRAIGLNPRIECASLDLTSYERYEGGNDFNFCFGLHFRPSEYINRSDRPGGTQRTGHPGLSLLGFLDDHFSEEWIVQQSGKPNQKTSRGFPVESFPSRSTNPSAGCRVVALGTGVRSRLPGIQRATLSSADAGRYFPGRNAQTKKSASDLRQHAGGIQR